jgi:CheY-like chemotaxis protein
MDRISKNIIFHITIVERNEEDHTFLRKVIHHVIPHAIVESVYHDEETVQYLNNCSSTPHLIFLDENMLQISGKDTVGLIKHADGLDKVPIIFLTNNNKSQRTDFDKQNADHFYSKPYSVQHLLEIVGSVNKKWLA